MQIFTFLIDFSNTFTLTFFYRQFFYFLFFFKKKKYTKDFKYITFKNAFIYTHFF